MLLEVWLPTRTVCVVSLRKSRIQLQREVLSPSWSSLQISCCGIMVLKAELKSMKSILTCECFFQVGEGWVESRADCVLCGTFGPVCELKGVQGGGGGERLVWPHDMPFKAFNKIGG